VAAPNASDYAEAKRRADLIGPHAYNLGPKRPGKAGHFTCGDCGQSKKARIHKIEPSPQDHQAVAFTCPTCNGTDTLAVDKAKLHAFLTGGA
jgi:transcription elongation factor Elf1